MTTQIFNKYVTLTLSADGTSLQWRHNEPNGVSSHQHHDCLLNCLFRHRLKKTSKLRVTGLCEGNSPVTREFPAQRASYAESVSIWWRHHVLILRHQISLPNFNCALSNRSDALQFSGRPGRSTNFPFWNFGNAVCSQAIGEKKRSSQAIRRCSRVVPDRGSPIRNTGRLTGTWKKIYCFTVLAWHLDCQWSHDIQLAGITV